MSRASICTVVSESYQWFIPLFVYSAKRAYPDYNVQIFVRGNVHERIKELCEKAEPGWKIRENKFMGFTTRKSTCNALRFLIPEKYFKDVDVVYFTDVDFIIFRHNPTLADYYLRIMAECKTPMAAARGPISGIKRPEIFGKLGWDKHFTRICAGTFCAKFPEWFEQTKDARDNYRSLLEQDRPDGYDHHKPCSYREYDEVMLYRICKGSGLKVPHTKYCFPTMEVANATYRDIHLGDFKARFRRRFKSMAKMPRIFKRENVANYGELEKEKTWEHIVKVCRANDETLDVMFKRFQHHVRDRRKNKL